MPALQRPFKLMARCASTAAATTTQQSRSSMPSDTPTPAVKSSVPAGQPLKGLNYFKDKADPLSLNDAEYPRWVWVLGQESATKTPAQEKRAAKKLQLKSNNFARKK